MAVRGPGTADIDDARSVAAGRPRVVVSIEEPLFADAVCHALRSFGLTASVGSPESGAIAVVDVRGPSSVASALAASALVMVIEGDGTITAVEGEVTETVASGGGIASLAAVIRRHAARGESPADGGFDLLTPRETAVLGLLMGGHSAEQIAEREFIAVATVRSHIQSVLRKLRVSSQIAAVALAHEVGWTGTRSRGPSRPTS